LSQAVAAVEPRISCSFYGCQIAAPGTKGAKPKGIGYVLLQVLLVGRRLLATCTVRPTYNSYCTANRGGTEKQIGIWLLLLRRWICSRNVGVKYPDLPERYKSSSADET